MQFVKSCRILAVNIINNSSIQSGGRQFHAGAGAHYRFSSLLRNPRGHSRVTSENDVYLQQTSSSNGERDDSQVNRSEKFTRKQPQSAESDLQEIENNLFDNRRQNENLQLNDILPRYKKESFYENQRINKKEKKPSKSHKLGELDLETIDTLKSFNQKDKSVEIHDKKSGLKYLKLKKGDPLFGDLRLLVTSRKRRELKNMLVLEGKRLILDGLEAGLVADTILFTESDELKGLRIKKGSVRLIQVSNHTLQEWSDLVTSPGVIGIFKKPTDMSEIMIRNQTVQPLPITVVCDNIREPNNLGSIIRSCAAIPVANVVLLKGCTHPWDLKCLRGGAGAHFRTSIVGPLTIDELEGFIPSNASFLVADNKSDGNDETFSFSPYDAANYYEMEHMVLVIGGEAHGVSSDVRRFIADATRNSPNKGNKNYNIHIPLENGVESLNTASAVSVILCEIRRQLKIFE